MTADPGMARTTLTAHVGGITGRIQALAGRLFNDAARGALPTLFAATQDIPNGSYVGPDGFQQLRGHPGVQDPPKTARDPDTARQLWTLSASLTRTVPTCDRWPGVRVAYRALTCTVATRQIRPHGPGGAK